MSEPARPRQERTTIRILLVEDDPEDTSRIRRLLAACPDMRFEIAHALRVEDALRMVRDGEHDVVLLDLTLSETEGLDTLARAKVAAASVPIVVMTNESDEALALQALRLGAQDYLAKGESDSRFLVRTLRHAVERHRMLLELRVAREREHFLATHDNLTGLPNRFAFRENLRRALAFAGRNARHVAVLFLDLDRFKGINDSLGHPVGDALLKTAAERLGRQVRESDMVARLGGDEFVLLLQGLEREYAPAKVASKVLDALAQAYVLEGREYWITGSIGIAIFPRDGTDADTLLRNADTAMYVAKRNGPNRYHFYADRMNDVAAERLSLETDLRGALEAGDFELYYQPQVDAALGSVWGAEALIRWRHAERGLVSPSSFVSVAEETGMIEEIGAWVLRRACQDAVGWPDGEGGPLRVSVNVSGRQVGQNGFADLVARILREAGLPAHRLDLELTESTVLEERGITLANLVALRKLGVRILIDDFGTGYSSLSALRQIPADGLKIDRSFVADVATDATEGETTSGLIRIARGRRLEVVAEGVETREQFDFLLSHNCPRMQGYLFGKPTPAPEFAQQLAAGPDGWCGRIPEPSV